MTRLGQTGRRGVALLAVLWVLAGAGTALALGLATVRDGIATSRYRAERTRARWAAEGCLTEFRANLERTLARSTRSAPSAPFAVDSDAWLDPRRHAPEPCALHLSPPSEGPIEINGAPDSLLLTLPGFDAEIVAVVRRERAWGRRIQHLDGLLSVLPPDLRDRLAAHYAELVGRVVFTPPAWVVTGHGVVAGRAVPVVSEWWVRAGSRVAVVRREVR